MPTCQGQHPDGSPCRNPAPTGQSHCYIHRRPDPTATLTREDVLAAIEEHGGPEELDLSREDLALAPLWSANLRGAYLRGARLWAANLQGADLVGANLQAAQLVGANLQGAELGGANLQGASLWEANLHGANLKNASLRGAVLRGAKLERVDLTVAKDITAVRWYDALLDKTRMRREQLGQKIGDELAAERGKSTYDQAREAYLALKTNFNELGRYDDASWAYRKERRMERAMSRWRRAAAEHAVEHEGLAKRYLGLGWLWFYTKHTLRWLWDAAVELATDYGESPGRVLGWAALLLLLVYPFIYWWCAGRPAPAGDLPAFAKDYLLLSLGAFSTLDVVNLSAANTWTRLWAASEAMAGISLLALLMFTLGNRISRS